MPDKVLIYSRFPKALMERIGERFELLERRRQAAERSVFAPINSPTSAR